MPVLKTPLLISPELRIEWANLSIDDIKKSLVDRGLTFKLANTKNRHFVVQGKVREVSLYATTGTVNAKKHQNMKPTTAKQMSPERAFDRLATIANIGY
jgi:hypothetical protein